MGDSISLSFDEYLALPAWGASSLRAMRRGPPGRVMWERQYQRGDTDAMLLGRLVHCALLTPHLLDDEFVAKPEGMTFASREGKAWRDEQTAQIVPHETYKTARSIAVAVEAKKPSGESLDKASHKEATLLWTCPVSREECKGRPDWIQGHHVYDLKVSRHADSYAIGLRAFGEGWMHQLAHYRTGAQALGMGIRGGRIVLVSPTAPHFVHTLEVKPDALDLLEIENIETLKAMRACRLANHWPGTPDAWTLIEPPAAAIAAFGEVVLAGEDQE